MAEQKQLWEINDVVLNNNYSSQNTAYGVYYSLATARADLPAGFYASERDDATRSREEAERVAELSGRSAQNERNAGGTNDPNYQTPSERTETAPYVENVLSSGSDAQQKRSKGKRGKGEKK
ncbi:hypothetical protein ONS95_000061 [Cadophora gregata]|uniref:uncharacterized protein n=1 Tax=Cadophora gregata TaxID=51156 RepID=UPI0026DD660C|nr:uncharacterized protein ONS95_000061 [Cadophora gregata]KAK0115671.1 hypothetical protein ONS96_014117 [Cadophora gregata f. sp. sojae]KAK0128077.1 hypothetical protein ONS95_000061 [Cadophora gregata]